MTFATLDLVRRLFFCGAASNMEDERQMCVAAPRLRVPEFGRHTHRDVRARPWRAPSRQGDESRPHPRHFLLEECDVGQCIVGDLF